MLPGTNQLAPHQGVDASVSASALSSPSIAPASLVHSAPPVPIRPASGAAPYSRPASDLTA